MEMFNRNEQSNLSCLAASFRFPEQQNIFYVLLTSFLNQQCGVL